jgi:AraC-like DNA-binding protein
VEVPWHWHQDFELVYIAEGTALLMTEDGEYRMNQGDGCFVNGNMLHALRVESPRVIDRIIIFNEKIFAHPDGMTCRKYVQSILANRNVKFLPFYHMDPEDVPILEEMKTVWGAVKDGACGYEAEVREALGRILVLIWDASEKMYREHDPSDLRTEKRVKQMIRFVEAHFAEDITINQIAESAGVSVSECLRCFHRKLHITPIQFVKKHRIARAAEMLFETESTVAGVAAACGFSDMSYFFRAFRRAYGCTPAEYRAKVCGETGLHADQHSKWKD